MAFFHDGAGRRIRTDDLLITNQLLYQLSYAGAARYESRFSELINWLDLFMPQNHEILSYGKFWMPPWSG